MASDAYTKTESQVPQLIPAATVVVVRDGAAGLEVLLLKRTNERGAFGGYSVFPGGRVDAEDADVIATAVREAREETGLELDPASLVSFSEWTPPATEMRRFQTAFFLAPAPIPTPEVVVDINEIVAYEWITPADVLVGVDEGRFLMAPPTWITLHTLSAHATVASAVQHFHHADTPRFVTELRRVEGGIITMWEGDVAYGNPDMSLDEPGPRHRLRAAGTSWVYERG